MDRVAWLAAVVGALTWASVGAARAAEGRSEAQDEADVLRLAKEFDVAVATHDMAAVDRALLDDYVLVTGTGRIVTKADLMKELATPKLAYQINESHDMSVRVHGDTAVVVAVLEQKWTEDGKAFDVPVRYTDTYVRTAKGWRQISGHACRLPKTN